MPSSALYRWTLAEAQDDAAVIIAGSIIPDNVSEKRGVLFLGEFSIYFVLEGRSYGLQFPHEEVASRLKQRATVILSEDKAAGRCWIMDTCDG